MSVQSEITRLQNAKSALKTAIENKGITVPSSTKIDGYADLVDSINGDGSSSSDEWLYFNAKPTIGFKGNVYVEYDSSKLELQMYLLTTGGNYWDEYFSTGEPSIIDGDEVNFRVKPRNLSNGYTSVIEFKNGDPDGSTKPTYTFGMIQTYSEENSYDIQSYIYKFAIVSIT